MLEHFFGFRLGPNIVLVLPNSQFTVWGSYFELGVFLSLLLVCLRSVDVNKNLLQKKYAGNFSVYQSTFDDCSVRHLPGSRAHF